jgi:hypothetical protein
MSGHSHGGVECQGHGDAHEDDHAHSHSHGHSHGGVECDGNHGDISYLPGENGAVVCDGYSWAQDREFITISMPIGAVKGKDVVYKLSPTALCIGIKGSAPVIDGEIFGAVKPDDSLWEVEVVEGQRNVVAKLQKAKAKLWGSLLKAA